MGGEVWTTNEAGTPIMVVGKLGVPPTTMQLHTPEQSNKAALLQAQLGLCAILAECKSPTEVEDQCAEFPDSFQSDASNEILRLVRRASDLSDDCVTAHRMLNESLDIVDDVLGSRAYGLVERVERVAVLRRMYDECRESKHRLRDDLNKAEEKTATLERALAHAKRKRVSDV